MRNYFEYLLGKIIFERFLFEFSLMFIILKFLTMNIFVFNSNEYLSY